MHEMGHNQPGPPEEIIVTLTLIIFQIGAGFFLLISRVFICNVFTKI